MASQLTTTNEGNAVRPSDIALSVRGLEVRFDSLRAVDGISFDVRRGQIIGVIGESGSGKSTLVKAIAGLVPIAGGEIEIAEENGPLERAKPSVGRAGQVQMIFQDAALALNPLRPVWKSVAEPMEPRKSGTAARLRVRAVELLEQVGLGAEIADRKSGQMSGGQRQRVTIARAVASRAPLVMCDEPVAALDLSLQAGVLKLLDELRRELMLTYVFISHDMSSIARIADTVGVMYLGQMVEIGPVRDVLQDPRHPYTQALIRAVPSVSRQGGAIEPLKGEIPDARNPPSGCRFRTRCPFAQQICVEQAPRSETATDSVGGTLGQQPRQTACHFWREIRNGTATKTAVEERRI